MFIKILFVSVLALAGCLKAEVVIDLPTPDLSDANILYTSAGLRPYRKSGIRLEVEKMNDKVLIHDYGHGGAGISLSWGCAQEALKLMEQYVSNKQSPIAVIGAGAIGLATAHLLKDCGYTVNVYSKEFVPNTTSNKAAGMFSPNFRMQTQDCEQFERIKKISYDKFYQCATGATPEFQGVFLRPAYSIKEEEKTNFSVEVRMNGVTKVCKKQEFLVFDLNIYLSDVFTQAQKKGVVFHQKNIRSKVELLDMQEAIIFNCTGLGSRELFQDADLVPVKGHLIAFRRAPEIDYILFDSKHQTSDLFFSLIPWESQLILGGTLEEGIEDPSVDSEMTLRLLQGARDFLIFNSPYAPAGGGQMNLLNLNLSEQFHEEL